MKMNIKGGRNRLAVKPNINPNTHQETGKKKSSYASDVIEKDFTMIMTEMKAAKPELTKQHLALLEERYVLTNQPAQGVTMFRGKPVQDYKNIPEKGSIRMVSNRPFNVSE